MGKLIKPFELTKPEALYFITFIGTKKFSIQNVKFMNPEQHCSLRCNDDVLKPYWTIYIGYRTSCKRIAECNKCFYNAKNYLNVLKYRKKVLNS